MDEFESLLRSFNQTIVTWRQGLERYSYQEIRTSPGVESWSIGQVVLHIIEESHWYLDQISKCLKSDENAEKGISPKIERWFEQHSFPNKRFKGPPDLPTPLQPASKEALLNQFDDLNNKIREVGKMISSCESKGRAKHPSNGYLNAKEWYQYTEMHMRHHLRQKERLDNFLRNKK